MARANTSAPISEHQTHPIRRGMEARDVDAMLAALAPDVVIHSPVTATPITGREPVRALLQGLVDHYEKWEVYAEFIREDLHVMAFRARIGGQDVEMVDVSFLDDLGLIREMRLHGRPMGNVASYASTLGPGLARHRGRVRSFLVRAITAPLPAMLRAGDRLVARIGLPRR
jgi:hypothetical protein